jgi:hypothetical protein
MPMLGPTSDTRPTSQIDHSQIGFGVPTGDSWTIAARCRRDLRISSAQIREPRRQRKVDLRIQVIKLHLNPSESGADVSSYLLPKIADAKRAASQHADKQADQKDHHDHGDHPLGWGTASVLLDAIPGTVKPSTTGTTLATAARVKIKYGMSAALSTTPGLGALKTKKPASSPAGPSVSPNAALYVNVPELPQTLPSGVIWDRRRQMSGEFWQPPVLLRNVAVAARQAH